MKQALRYNNKIIKKIYQGDELVKKMNYGQSSDVFQYIKNDGDTPTPPAPSYDEQYLTIESTSDNNTIYWRSNYVRQFKTISASTDNGSTWTAYTSSSKGNGTTIATLNSGDTIIFKGENAQYYAKGIFKSSSSFIAYGNIMSLVYGDNFSGQTTLTSGDTFNSLFLQCYRLTSAENLVLPATTLTNNCYQNMFYYCTSLTVAPELPATTLAQSCYQQMFVGCHLTTAPALPATTLVSNCYSQMFNGCASLTTAPELPATTLVSNCYSQMFNGCANLTYIKCLATDISASNCTAGWVGGVAASGNFYVPSGNPASWKCGSDGVPSNWTIVDTNGHTYECTGGGEPSTDVPLQNTFAVKVNGEWQESMELITNYYEIEFYLHNMGIDEHDVEELAIGNETSDEINLDGNRWYSCTGLTLAQNVRRTSDIHNFQSMQWVNVMSRQLDYQGFTRLFSDMNCCPIYVPEAYFSDYQMYWENETTDDCEGTVADRLVAWTNPNN